MLSPPENALSQPGLLTFLPNTSYFIRPDILPDILIVKNQMLCVREFLIWKLKTA